MAKYKVKISLFSAGWPAKVSEMVLIIDQRPQTWLKNKRKQLLTQNYWLHIKMHYWRKVPDDRELSPEFTL